jgi:tRNA 2-selenouridine synthase
MTSSQDSSKSDSSQPSVKDVESLAGLFHPHAIEIQDFSYYGLILDVRSQADFDDDHIPGALRLATAGLTAVAGEGQAMAIDLALDAGANAPLSQELEALVAPVKLNQAILVYCGRGGRDSLPVARALRWRGWTVDVLPGGWANYRRWVQAGLESLPRLIAFRVVTASLGSEMARLLGGLSQAGQQVLDVAALAGWRVDALVPTVSVQPTQARFESRLLQALRQIDPRRTVWVADADRLWGRVTLPGALMDALGTAPAVALACPLAERLACWREDEPLLNGSIDDILRLAATASPLSEPPLLDTDRGTSDSTRLLTRLLSARDERWRVSQGASERRRPALPALITSSLAPDSLVGAIRRWLQKAKPSELS